MQLERTGFHGTEATEIVHGIARIELFAQHLEAICVELDLCDDIAGDRGDTIEIEPCRLVAGSEGDLEKGSRKIGIILAGDERSRPDDVFGRDERRKSDGDKNRK